MDIPYWLKILMIGIIQGLTEPLPISSSAHMTIFKQLLNININNINFEILINFASCLAIAFFFRKKIFYLFKNSFSKDIVKYKHLNKSFLLKLIIASIPIAISGLLLKDIIEVLFSSQIFVSISLLITSIMLLGIYLMLSKKKILTDEISYRDSFLIGLAQSIAIFPGISRSGTTFFSGTTRNIKLNFLFDFSFFLYLIASIGSMILSVTNFDIFGFIKEQNILLLVLVFSITFITTLLSISIFSKLLSKQTIYYFFIYTLILGSFLLFTNLLLLLPIH